MTSKTFLNTLNKSLTVEGLNIINEFFIAFSRFECALKVSGFANGDNDKVSANWDTFVASIRTNFDNLKRNREILAAIDYLTNHPPSVQNYANGQLGWRERIHEPNVPLINKLSLSIRDIRNNLFHGGKFSGNYQEDVSRNFILLKSAIVLINHWLQLSELVKNNFLEPIR